MENPARTHTQTRRKNDLPVGVLCPCRPASPQAASAGSCPGRSHVELSSLVASPLGAFYTNLENPSQFLKTQRDLSRSRHSLTRVACLAGLMQCLAFSPPALPRIIHSILQWAMALPAGLHPGCPRDGATTQPFANATHDKTVAAEIQQACFERGM